MASVHFFYDFSSPYSYLAVTQLPKLIADTGATIRYSPMVLYKVFEATGNRNPALVPRKAVYMLADLRRWADHYGVPFTMNTKFPLNTIGVMRLALVAEQHGRQAEVVREAFHRTWALDRDITADAEIAAIAAAAELPPDAVDAVRSPEIKEALKARTDEAIARGVFGAPAFLVGEALFWGNDRMDFIVEALRKDASPA